MISNEAQELNSTFRRDLKESGTFDGPVEEVRAAWDAFGDAIPAYAPDVSIEPVDAGGVNAEWVTMPGVTGDWVLLHFHGGGYVIERPSTYRNFNARMSEAAHARVLASNYRLAPEHPFPATVDDTLAAYKWALEQGHAPENIGFMGESAGGCLVLATVLAARDSGLPMPAAAVTTSPWYDLGNNGQTHTSNAEADPMVAFQIPEGRAAVARMASFFVKYMA